MKNCYQLSTPELYNLAEDARVVAIRWDLISSSLILDLDTPIAESSFQSRRVWLCFEEVESFIWPAHQARIPTGCFLASIVEETETGPSYDFRIAVLLPRFEKNKVVPGSLQEIRIRARKLHGAASTNGAEPTEYGLEFDQRRRLASDEDLLGCLSEDGTLRAHAEKLPMQPRIPKRTKASFEDFAPYRTLDLPLLRSPFELLVGAFRWDLIPFGLVIDFDRFNSASKPSERLWICFRGLSQISWPQGSSFFPPRCALLSGVAYQETKEKIRDYRFLVGSDSDQGTVEISAVELMTVALVRDGASEARPGDWEMLQALQKTSGPLPTTFREIRLE